MAKKAKTQAQRDFEALPNHLQLFKLQKPKNNGRGVACVRDICWFMARNEQRKVKACVDGEWDKISSYPDICAWLKAKGWADKNAYVTKP